MAAAAPPTSFVDAAFAREEIAWLRRLTWARAATVAAIVIWIAVNYGPVNAWDSILLTSLLATAAWTLSHSLAA